MGSKNAMWLALLLLSACRPAEEPPAPVQPPLPEASAPTCHVPDPRLTPGKLCTPDDEYFIELRYAEGVAICRRHVTQATKEEVARRYGYARADASLEIDHLLPLAIGGSNALSNLFAQPLADARKKDLVEDDAYRGMRDGTLKQADAIRMMLEWKPEGCL